MKSQRQSPNWEVAQKSLRVLVYFLDGHNRDQRQGNRADAKDRCRADEKKLNILRQINIFFFLIKSQRQCVFWQVDARNFKNASLDFGWTKPWVKLKTRELFWDEG